MKTLHKLLISLCSLICLLACILTLVFYFAYKPSPSSGNSPILLQDMVIMVGGKREIKYTLSNKEATVEFSCIDENIATIQDEFVFGVKEGVTFIKAKVTIDDKTYYSTSQLKVISNEEGGDNPISPQPERKDYYYKVNCIQSCTFEDPVLFINSPALISITLFDDKDLVNKVQYNEVDVFASNNVCVTRELMYFMIEANSKGFVYFTFKELKLTIYIEIQV